MLGLCCCAGFSLVAATKGCSLVAVRRLLIMVASLVAEHRLLIMVASLVAEHGLKGTQASVVVVPGPLEQRLKSWGTRLVG